MDSWSFFLSLLIRIESCVRSTKSIIFSLVFSRGEIWCFGNFNWNDVYQLVSFLVFHNLIKGKFLCILSMWLNILEFIIFNKNINVFNWFIGKIEVITILYILNNLSKLWSRISLNIFVDLNNISVIFRLENMLQNEFLLLERIRWWLIIKYWDTPSNWILTIRLWRPSSGCNNLFWLLFNYSLWRCIIA